GAPRHLHSFPTRRSSDLSPRYGERWGRHWLDVARYADTGGFEADHHYPGAWKYRDYVLRSLNADKPFDRFVREQVAGDELWPRGDRKSTRLNSHHLPIPH